MGKRGGSHPVPGHFTSQGRKVEDRDTARSAKAALARETAKRQRRAGRKTKLGEAPKEQRAKEPPKPGARPTTKVEARVEAEAHGREYARMNERKPVKRMRPAAKPAPQPARKIEGGRGDDVHQPRYLSETARVVIRKVAKFAYTPVAIARAVVDRIRDRE